MSACDQSRTSRLTRPDYQSRYDQATALHHTLHWSSRVEDERQCAQIQTRQNVSGLFFATSFDGHSFQDLLFSFFTSFLLGWGRNGRSWLFKFPARENASPPPPPPPPRSGWYSPHNLTCAAELARVHTLTLDHDTHAHTHKHTRHDKLPHHQRRLVLARLAGWLLAGQNAARKEVRWQATASNFQMAIPATPYRSADRYEQLSWVSKLT